MINSVAQAVGSKVVDRRKRIAQERWEQIGELKPHLSYSHSLFPC